MHARRLFVFCGLTLVAGCATRLDTQPGEVPADRPLVAPMPPPPLIEAPASTAQPDLSQPLDLTSCVRMALAGNRDLRIRESAVARARLECRKAWRSVLAPVLTTSYTVTNDDDTAISTARVTGNYAGFRVEPYVTVDVDGTDHTGGSEYGLVLSRQVFRMNEGLRQSLPMTRAGLDLRRAANDRILELRDLRLAVSEAFLNLQRGTARLAIRVSRISDAEEFQRQVETRVEQGFAAAVEVTYARISLNQARADELQERLALRSTQERLLILLGASPAQEIAITNADLTAFPALDIDLDRDVATMRERHERVQNHLIAMELMRQEARLHTDAALPDLAATLTMARQQDSDGPFSGPRDDRVALGLVLTIPLDGYGVESAVIAQDRLRWRELGWELASIRAELERQTRERFRTVQQSAATLALAEERLTAEKVKLEASLLRYQNGAIDNLEVTRAQRDVDTAALALLDARIERVLSLARYQAALPPQDDAAHRTGGP